MLVITKMKAVGRKGIIDATKPTKVCEVCQRPFTWRRKWKNCWDDVKYCSQRCRGLRNQNQSPTN